ncbi:MAG TPA: carboxypeptidase regulatory-like domain-containing protein, partial [Candidatus Angelobacter sp.]|nr:carboxypeptidase regulatory-like domain-containing protein [Candidatus Angelobacter sp.]
MKFWPSGTRAWLSAFVASILLCCSGAVLAQGPAGRLRGQVTDPTGAVIPGASITVKNSSGLVVSATSDGAGAYDVKNLPAGKYTVSVTAKGFAPVKQQIDVVAGQEKRADIALEIVVKEESIDVQGDAARVGTGSDNNASSLVISGKDLDALSDDPDELQSELQALAGPSAGPNGGQIYIDGFTGGQLPPKSSIREIRINQNPFSAQYERMGFGRIEILTKPGTDKLHGQFSFNDNHSFLDALNPFAASEPDFSTQMVSGNVGGPLGKKASYQINAERRNINEAAVVLPAAFAAANQPVIGVLNPRVRTNVSSRFDFQIAASNTLMVRYQFTHNHEENNGISQLSLPSQGFNQTGNENEIQVSDTQILSPHAV